MFLLEHLSGTAFHASQVVVRVLVLETGDDHEEEDDDDGDDDDDDDDDDGENKKEKPEILVIKHKIILINKPS